MNRRDVVKAAVVGAAAAAGGLALGSGAPVRLERAALSRQDREDAERAADNDVARLGQRQVIWSVPAPHAGSAVALTFDDGPDPQFTPRVLQALADAGVHATFNVMGYNAMRHPELLRQTVAAGHEIGNHTWTHKDLAFESQKQIRVELTRGRDEIEQVTQAPLRFLRPPRGELPGAALRTAAELGYDVLMWSVTRGPASGPDEQQRIVDYVTSTVRPGDVLGMHDGIGRGTFARNEQFARDLAARRNVEIRALPDILARIAARGLTLTTAASLIDASRDSGASRAG